MEREKNSRSMAEVIDSPDFDRGMGNFMRARVIEIMNKKSGYPSIVRKWIVYAVGKVYQSIVGAEDEK